MKTSELKKYLSKERYSPIAKRIIRGAFWLTLGSLIARVMTLVANIFVVRILERESYGSFAIIQSSVVMTGVFAGLGLGMTVIKYIAEFKERDKKRLAKIITLTNRIAFFGAFLISLLFAIGSDFIASNLLNNSEISELIFLSSISLFFNALFGYYNSTLIGFEAVRESGIVQLVAAILSLPLLIFLTDKYALIGAVWGLIIQSIFLFLFSFFFYLKQFSKLQIKPNHLFGKDEWKIIRNFTIPAFLTGIIVMPVHWICYALLVNTDNGNSEMALIGIVMQWFYAIMFLPALAGRIVLPILSDLQASGEQQQISKTLKLSMKANAIILVPITLGLAFLSPWIMSLYGPEYRENWLVLVFVVAAALVSSLLTPIGHLIVATGRMWLSSMMNLLWAIIYIILSWQLIETGALGITIALFIAYLALFLWTTLYVIKYQKENLDKL